MVVSATTVLAQSTNTLSFYGASWNDGGSLDGYFTISYDATGTPLTLLSADITTGNSTPGFYSGGQTFNGFEYIYDVSGKENTAGPSLMGFISATENSGAPANELSLSPLDDSSHYLFLDWQGSTPTSLYLGDSDGQYSSESYSGDPATRSLNTSGGSVGSAPEPGTFALVGLGAAGLLVFRRRK